MADPNGLHGVDLRHLAALEAVARDGTVTAAARSLGYTQSAVSGQLASLERLVGQPLVVRRAGARGVSLTPAGQRLLEHASAIRRRLAAAGADLASFAAGVRPLVRLGAVPSLAAVVVPAAARALARRAPEAELRVEESHLPGTLQESLQRGDADLVIAPLTGAEELVDAAELGADPYVLLVPRRDVLARLERPVGAVDLDGRDVVAKDCGTPSQRAVERALRAHGVAVTVRVRAHDARTVHGLVGSGAGVAFLPRLLVDPADAATVALPVDDAWLAPRRIALFRASGAEPSPATAIVEDAVRRAAVRRLAVGAPA